MANKRLNQLEPEAEVVLSGDYLHLSQGGIDKRIKATNFLAQVSGGGGAFPDFLQLDDTPSSYDGFSRSFIRVNDSGDGLVFDPTAQDVTIRLLNANGNILATDKSNAIHHTSADPHTYTITDALSQDVGFAFTVINTGDGLVTITTELNGVLTLAGDSTEVGDVSVPESAVATLLCVAPNDWRVMLVAPLSVSMSDIPGLIPELESKVSSVTGDGVDNTDPANPVLRFGPWPGRVDAGASVTLLSSDLGRLVETTAATPTVAIPEAEGDGFVCYGVHHGSGSLSFSHSGSVTLKHPTGQTPNVPPDSPWTLIKSRTGAGVWYVFGGLEVSP